MEAPTPKPDTAAVEATAPTTLLARISRQRRPLGLLGLLLLASLFLFGWGIGSYSLWDPWEPKYAGAMMEMAERGDFITPYFNDKIRWTKPILVYWAMAVPMALFGNTEFTARLPSALAGVCGVGLVFFFLWRLRGLRTGLVGAAMLATFPQYAYLARQAMPDMLLTAFLAGTMGFFALGRFGGQRHRLYFLLAYGCFALATLAKGPVAGVIVIGAIGLFWLVDFGSAWLDQPRQLFRAIVARLKAYYVFDGAMVFLIIAGPWYLMMLLIHGWDFIDSFIVSENLHRFSEPVRDHNGTASYYVQDMFHGMYPWFGIVVGFLPFVFYGVDRNSEEFRQRWYYLSWALAIFFIFTIAGTKIDHYILPLVPVLAVIAALFWERYLDPEAPLWVRGVLAVGAVMTWIPIRDFLIENDRYIFKVFTNARNMDYPLVLPLKLFLGAWVLIMLFAMVRRRSQVAVALALVVPFIHMVFMNHVVLPQHTPKRTMQHYIAGFEEVRPDDAELLFYGKIRYTMYYYYGKERFTHFESNNLTGLVSHVGNRRNVYIISSSSRASRLLNQLRRIGQGQWYVLMSHHPRYVLLSNNPRQPVDAQVPEREEQDES